jgi:hypothetical protein
MLKAQMRHRPIPNGVCSQILGFQAVKYPQPPAEDIKPMGKK